MGVHQEDFGRIRGVHQLCLGASRGRIKMDVLYGSALRACINFVLVHQEGASRGMCSRGLRQESFLILCDALRACTAKRGRLLKINLSILNCIFQHRFERIAPAS